MLEFYCYLIYRKVDMCKSNAYGAGPRCFIMLQLREGKRTICIFKSSNEEFAGSFLLVPPLLTKVLTIRRKAAPVVTSLGLVLGI